MKEIILQKCNFRCRENIYICRPLRRLRRLAVEYVKKHLRQELVNFEGAKHYIYDYSVDKYIHKIDGNSDLFYKQEKHHM